MAKDDVCLISNCKNKITYKGKICGTHRWRMKKFKSYDLPSYSGIPNYLIKPKLPSNIVKMCEKHGELKIEDCYLRYYKGNISTYYCKKCALGKNIERKYKGMKGIECYDKLLKQQNNVCAICKMPNLTKRNGKIKRLAIDHMHNKHKKIRGLLCQHCNLGIGSFRDSIEILENAIEYLKKHKD